MVYQCGIRVRYGFTAVYAVCGTSADFIKKK